MVVKSVVQYSRKQWCRIKLCDFKKERFRSKLIFYFCITAPLVSGFCAKARDLGTHGTIYPIEEHDPIALIQQKLKRMEERGELAKRNRELQSITKAAVERPKPVEGITKAQKNRTFYFDPTYVVEQDLKDHTGKVFYRQGTKINPLETIRLSHALLLFDGDDLEQKEWVKDKFQNGHVKLILVKGAPLSLSETWKVPVYFDQAGTLTKKFSITHVPALVTQEGLRLRIEETCPPIKPGAGSRVKPRTKDPGIKLGKDDSK